MLGLDIVRGFGWAWVVLGAGTDGSRRMRAALAAAGEAAPAYARADALLLAGWLEASSGDLDQATADIEEAMALEPDLVEVGRLHLSFVRSQQGRAADALALLDRCRPAFAERGQAWEEAASWVLTAWAEIASGNLAAAPAACARALELLQPLGDNWGRIHAEAMLGELAQAEHRYAEATGHLRHAPPRPPTRWASAPPESHHLTNLGRAQHQLGDHEAARATLTRAIEIGTASADLRTVALARIRLGRVLRDLGRDRSRVREVRAGRDWYAAAGSGEGQALAGYLLAALAADADDPAAEAGLAQMLAAARRAGNLETQVLTLDASARWYAEHGRPDHARHALREADRLWPAVAHLVTEADRADRVRALALLVVQGRSR